MVLIAFVREISIKVLSSPDLATPDSFVWDFITNHLYALLPRDTLDVRDKIADAPHPVTAEMLDNACRKLSARHCLCSGCRGGYDKEQTFSSTYSFVSDTLKVLIVKPFLLSVV
jgi:hypothetical protein